jgi:hypothetical protein
VRSARAGPLSSPPNPALLGLAERRLGEMMAEQPKAKPPGSNQYVDRVIPQPEAPMTLAQAGIDKNLAHKRLSYRPLTGCATNRLCLSGSVIAKSLMACLIAPASSSASTKPTNSPFFRTEIRQRCSLGFAGMGSVSINEACYNARQGASHETIRAVFDSEAVNRD